MWIVQVTPLAETELMTMPADMQARFVHIAEMLQEFGPQAVGLPHVRFLQDNLWEMRLKGRDGIARAIYICLLYTSPSPRDRTRSRMPSSA